MKIDPACKELKKLLAFYSIITPFDALKYHVFEIIMENGANIFYNIFKSN